MATSGTSSPCGACKFLRRKCATDCIFAPYFSSEQGPARFAAIHRVFGASNVSKMLSHLPVADRCEAVVTIAYEAHSRVKDPVFGCVSHIFALQHQVAWLQGQVMQAKSQIAQGQGLIESSNQENMWPAAGGNYMAGQANSLPVYNYMNNYVSPGSSQESIDQQYQNKASGGNCSFSKKLQSGSQIQLGELQEMANRMTRK